MVNGVNKLGQSVEASVRKDEEEEDKKLHVKSYLERERAEGTGPIRINTQLELSEDLYSMAFVSFLLPEYIYFHKNVKDNENGADDTDVDKAE